jgi:hypothetical protein
MSAIGDVVAVLLRAANGPGVNDGNGAPEDRHAS